MAGQSHRKLPPPIRALFTPNAYNHDYNTRARNDPRVSKHHYSAFHKSFLIRSPTIWSHLGTTIKNVTVACQDSLGMAFTR